MSPVVEAPSSVLLVVGREEFTPPMSFAGETCVATHDCLAVAVRPADDGPTDADFSAGTDGRQGLVELGRFSIECEGLLSLRDIWSREHGSAGVGPGLVEVTVLGDRREDPGTVRFVIAAG